MVDSLISSRIWQGGALPLMELASLWRLSEGHALSGSVVGALGGEALAVRYRVECTREWETRSVEIELTLPPAVRRMRIEVRPEGVWIVDGVERPELAGVRDVDIQITPSTNTLPIRRLGLAIGEEAEVTAAWVQLPSFELSLLPQSYRRMAVNEYEYRSRDFRADLIVDANGVVERYGSFWRRLQT